MLLITNFPKKIINSPIIRSFSQLPHSDWKLIRTMRLEEFLQAYQPFVVFVDDCERFPGPRLHQIDVSLKFIQIVIKMYLFGIYEYNKHWFLICVRSVGTRLPRLVSLIKYRYCVLRARINEPNRHARLYYLAVLIFTTQFSFIVVAHEIKLGK